MFFSGFTFFLVSFLIFFNQNYSINTLFLLLGWPRDVGQCQINVETQLCMSKLKFTTLKNVESTLSISTFILINNVSQCQNNVAVFNFGFTTLINVQTTLWTGSFFKKLKKAKKNIWASKKKMINNTCFWLWSNAGNYSSWYIKRIWKINSCIW